MQSYQNKSTNHLNWWEQSIDFIRILLPKLTNNKTDPNILIIYKAVSEKPQ